MKERIAVAIVALAGLSGSAEAQFSGNASQTLFLPGEPGAAMPIAYHPGFKQYYGSGGGWPGNPGFVWDASGNQLQGGIGVGVDVRSWCWNSNTNQLEIVPYGASWGAYPLVTPDLDGSGLLTGNNTSLLTPMPGFQNDQVSPAYDSGRDVFWSRYGDNEARQVRRSDGNNNNSSVYLDFGSAGISAGEIIEYNISYDPSHDLLGVQRVDVSPNVLYLFNASSGAFAGSNTLATDTPYPYYNGSFANGQYFQYVNGGYQGYKLVNVPAPATGVLLGVTALAANRRRRTA